MATTRLIPMHVIKGKTNAQTLQERIQYAINPYKTDECKYVTAYGCDPETAAVEMLLRKKGYEQFSGRVDEDRHDVLMYQIRQSFKPGEVTPELANKVGQELAMRFLKGKYQFVVATHVDHAHIHNHILFNATSIDQTQKFRNFYNSSFAIRKLSDQICLENGLSIVENPQHRHTDYGKWLGNKNAPSKRDAQQKLSLLIDIQAKLLEGKGAGYERWAKVFNLKQMAKTLNYLMEHKISTFEELEKKTAQAVVAFNEVAEKMKAVESRLAEINYMRQQIVNYALTKGVYDAYRESGFSSAFFEGNAEEINVHKAALEAYRAYPDKKVNMKKLQAEYLEQKKLRCLLRPIYTTQRKSMRELLLVKENVECTIGRGR